MKHVFIVNSHTTFLTTIGTIEFLKLNSDSVLLVYIRNYKNKIVNCPYPVYDLTDLSEDCFRCIKESRTNRNMIIKKVDAFIKQKITSQFKLYTPHFGIALSQILYTSDLCVEGSYLQEAAYSFKGAFLNSLSLWDKLRCFVLYHHYKGTSRIWRSGKYWYIQGSLNKQDSIKSFSVSNSFFKFLPSQNYKVKWPQIEVVINFDKNSRIFVFDGFVNNGLMEKDCYMNMCERLIKSYAQPMNYIKFHPAQSEDEKNTIISFFTNNKFQYNVMTNDIPMELIISSKKGLHIAGFSSSLIYFAMELGHDVICCEDWQVESPLYKKYRASVGITSLQ